MSDKSWIRRARFLMQKFEKEAAFALKAIEREGEGGEREVRIKAYAKRKVLKAFLDVLNFWTGKNDEK